MDVFSTGTGAGGDTPAVPELSLIQADDALLDALGGPDPQVADSLGDQELNALLLAWRRDIDSEPLAELVDTPEAVTTIKTAALAKRKGGKGRRRRMLVPVAAAAAVLAIGFTGTALAARDAQPGDTLWGLSKVLYADHARSVEAAASVRTELQEAGLAIAQQRFDDARRALEQAEQALGNVAGDELAQLKARHMELMAQLDQPIDEGDSQPPPTHVPDSTSSTVTGTKPSDVVPPPAGSTEPTPTENPTTPTTPPSETPTSSTPPPPSSSTDDTGGSESDSNNSLNGGSVASNGTPGN
ncbi:anti-sigma-D factor RsdA [Saccharomonospora sp. NPDC006951]